MSLFTVGRICMKIAGRDAGRKCVVVKTFENHYVLIDGAARRKKVNIRHLEPLSEEIEINEDASHEEVETAFKKVGWEVWKKKSKQSTERPRKKRRVKKKIEEKKKAKVKNADKKKEEKNVEESKKVEEKKGTKVEKKAEGKKEVEKSEKKKEAFKE